MRPTHSLQGGTRAALTEQKGVTAAPKPIIRPFFSSPQQHETKPDELRGKHKFERSQRGVQRGGLHPRTQRRSKPTPSPEKEFQPDKLALRHVGILPPRVQQENLQLKTGLAVTWLGTSSGTPTIDRNVSCTVVRTPNHTYLIDCGEGTHRQLPTINFDMHTVHSIFITHMHGDHCYGLGTTLLAIDEAKAAAQAAQNREASGSSSSSNSESERASSHSRASSSRRGDAGGAAQHSAGQPEPVIYVYGPPGLAELLRAQLIMTGAHRLLHCDVHVTEMVNNPEDALSPPQRISPVSEKLHFSRLPPKLVKDYPSLQVTAKMIAPRLQRLATVWKPNFRTFPVQDRGEDRPIEPAYDGRNYVAAEGLFWDLPSGAMRVAATQLQHRVPCFGYVLQEAEPYAEGQRKRKVTILGDTVNSKPIAPVAFGTDVLAHEATFSQGMEFKCRISQHSTGWMAGEFAAAVQAQCLVLTHFSARYGTGPQKEFPATGGKSRGAPGKEAELSVEQQLAMQSSAIKYLLAEARSRYQRGGLLAANDFFTVHVPLQTNKH
uniref:Metallo-beta-lactamase domain-containing protein n=1 Tax=Dunaliella tertiolecta TaxID=3047 RepID=A0A7S3RAJ1_DUNTE|mmetsp:Transcript_6796/g.18252  ORF Transcript_6796/g.18252 Transcript_6796/m.18252 type:complete len:548 (+) Transcript_6796:162-1805(+)|eukprot:CAMPEP_0202379770 /NCGR_PEP_ID=MMETSP1127-20130417/25516_1 /ASSEMBLY_ACC=CAM_ASM_000462 /TAXON_ID=3047 /ORGANISM="Dunaliella tertiolecta, Strain CCMP1320" /LENGTH=547 /DNA_ID=CAMNT_0048978339 /DNA_START=87 /DNA_END=1730 /DNA_ORIENTATION=-